APGAICTFWSLPAAHDVNEFPSSTVPLPVLSSVAVVSANLRGRGLYSAHHCGGHALLDRLTQTGDPDIRGDRLLHQLIVGGVADVVCYTATGEAADD